MVCHSATQGRLMRAFSSSGTEMAPDGDRRRRADVLVATQEQRQGKREPSISKPMAKQLIAHGRFLGLKWANFTIRRLGWGGQIME
jgi:hypothetical protein